MSERLRVAVLYGGPSAEHEISVVSARSVLQAIDRERYEVVPIAITKQGRWLLPARAPDALPAAEAGALAGVGEEDGDAIVLRARGEVVPVDEHAARPQGGPGAQIDVVFPVLHGPGGEDGTVQGMLETLGIAYVGAGVAASAVGMSKALQKPVFQAAGIPVTPWTDVRIEEFGRDVTAAVEAAVGATGLPCFVKPSSLGSSVGVSRCTTPGEVLIALGAAFEHDRLALVEPAIAGRELECGVLGNDDPAASVVGEIRPVNEFYDYEAKYVKEGSELIIPADVPDAIAKEIQEHAVAAFRAIGCEGLARVDFFWDGTRL